MRPVRLGILVQFLQPRQEAGFVAKLAGAIVVRMSPFPIRQDHHAGAQFADLDGQGHPRADGVLQPRSREPQIAAPLQAKVLGGRLSLLCLSLAAASRTAQALARGGTA
jgi:hypothetical protein